MSPINIKNNITEMNSQNNLIKVASLKEYAKKYNIPCIPVYEYFNKKTNKNDMFFYNSINQQQYNLLIKENKVIINDKLYENKETERVCLIYDNNIQCGYTKVCDKRFVIFDIDSFDGLSKDELLTQYPDKDERFNEALKRVPEDILKRSFITKSRNKGLPHLHILLGDIPSYKTKIDVIKNMSGLQGDFITTFILETANNDIYVDKDTYLNCQSVDNDNIYNLPNHITNTNGFLGFDDIIEWLDIDRMEIKQIKRLDYNGLPIKDEEIQDIFNIFKTSKYNQKEADFTYSDHNIVTEDGIEKHYINIQANKEYDCLLCNRRHENNSNRSLLIKSHDGIVFKCRRNDPKIKGKMIKHFNTKEKMSEYMEFIMNQHCLIKDEDDEVEEKKEYSNNNNTNVKYISIDKKQYVLLDHKNFKVEHTNLFYGKGNTEAHFIAMVEAFEQTHAKIVNKGLYIKILIDNDGNMIDVLFKSPKDIKDMYSHLVYKYPIWKEDSETGNMYIKKFEDRPFIKKWLEGYEFIRKYDDIDIRPYTNIKDDNTPKNIFNIWIPYSMEYIKEYTQKIAERDIILNHLRIQCDNNETSYKWFCKWIAHLIQRPYEKSGKLPCFTAKEGTGKTTLIILLGLLIGNNRVFETSDPKKDLFGQFNSIIRNCIVIGLNEVNFNDTHKDIGKLKRFITEPTVKIEMKGKDAMDINSFHRFILTTNEENPIRTSKDDRRNVIIRSSDELMGNKEYFEKLYKLLKDKDVIKTVYEYFKNDIIVEDGFMNEIPEATEYQKSLQDDNTHPIVLFLKHKAQKFFNEDKTTETILIDTKDLCSEFNLWCKDNQINCNMSSMKFGVKLSHERISGIDSYKASGGTSKKQIEIGKLCKYFKIDKKEEENKEEEKKEEEFKDELDN